MTTQHDIETLKEIIEDNGFRTDRGQVLSRALATLESLPVTADGVVVTPEMVLWTPEGDRHETYSLESSIDGKKWEVPDGNGGTLYAHLWYSDMLEAARAAKGGG